jgi:transcriptional regulator with GAF, ATPase, and Fis domain
MDEQPQDTPSGIERTHIRNALEQAHGDKALAARLLDLSLKELLTRMRQSGLTDE